jgi:hypothetical protein
MVTWLLNCHLSASTPFQQAEDERSPLPLPLSISRRPRSQSACGLRVTCDFGLRTRRARGGTGAWQLGLRMWLWGEKLSARGAPVPSSSICSLSAVQDLSCMYAILPSLLFFCEWWSFPFHSWIDMHPSSHLSYSSTRRGWSKRIWKSDVWFRICDPPTSTEYSVLWEFQKIVE